MKNHLVIYLVSRGFPSKSCVARPMTEITFNVCGLGELHIYKLLGIF